MKAQSARCAIACAILSIAGCAHPDPLYDGRPVSKWIERLDGRDTDRVQEAVEALVACGEPALPRVTAALNDPDQQIRAGAARVLLRCGPQSRQHVLDQFQQAKVPLVQLSMARAILAAGVDCPDAVHSVMASLKDENAGVRHEATHALGDLTSESAPAAPVLAGYLRSSDAEQRHHAALALIRIGPAASTATPALVESLKDSDPRVRHAAVQALAAIGEPARAAMPALVALRDDPSDLVRWQAGEVLKAWRE